MTDLMVRVGGVDLRVKVDGVEAGPPLALINVARSNLGVFEPMMAALGEAHRVIRHDWRGTGRSGAGERADYVFERYADDLAAILDAVDVERAVICGCAFGARIAARFAIRHPDRTSLLALYDVSLAPPADQGRQRELMLEARRLRDEAGLPHRRLDRSCFVHDAEKEALRSLTAGRGLPDPTPEMATVRIPTLVVCGRQDENLTQAQRIAGLMPDCELQVMEMTSHPAVMSRPDLAAELLLDFVKRRESWT